MNEASQRRSPAENVADRVHVLFRKAIECEHEAEALIALRFLVAYLKRNDIDYRGVRLIMPEAKRKTPFEAVF